MPDIYADFTKRVVIFPDDQTWVPSPAPGVDRVMLDRVGDEVARATSFVRYAPNSQFPEHQHGGGEEFIVLDGIFSDESGDFIAGSYIRNPVGTKHAPFTRPGCTIFVKLWQFEPADQEQFCIETPSRPWQPGPVPGVEIMPLHEYGQETCQLLKLTAGAALPDTNSKGGEEILVLEGAFEDGDGTYPTGTWIRSPDGDKQNPRSPEGCIIWVKTGHLQNPFPQALPKAS